MSRNPSHTPPRSPDGAQTYERSDFGAGPIVWAMLIGSIVIALVFVAMWVLTGVFADYEARRSPPAHPLAAAAGRQQPPAPRLQPDPVKDMNALRAFEDAQLNSYAWIDKPAGKVRIPIDRAIDLVAERGLPFRAVEPGK
jgi:hypothetical protein